jgi:hypothetical protein
LGYLSELEYDLETLNNYISDFQLLNDNMIQNLHESNIKMNEYQNEICRLKQALDRANDEIHRLRNQNVYNYAYTRNKEFDIKNKFVMNNSEEEKNVDNTNKFNYFRNYLNSTHYNNFRKVPNDMSGRFTYRNLSSNNRTKINYNNLQKSQKSTTIRTKRTGTPSKTSTTNTTTNTPQNKNCLQHNCRQFLFSNPPTLPLSDFPLSFPQSSTLAVPSHYRHTTVSPRSATHPHLSHNPDRVVFKQSIHRDYRHRISLKRSAFGLFVHHSAQSAESYAYERGNKHSVKTHFFPLAVDIGNSIQI